MRFAEISLFGVYIAPIVPLMGLGFIILWPLHRLAGSAGLLRHVWHPALFLAALYMIVLSVLVLLAGKGVI